MIYPGARHDIGASVKYVEGLLNIRAVSASHRCAYASRYGAQRVRQLSHYIEARVTQAMENSKALKRSGAAGHIDIILRKAIS